MLHGLLVRAVHSYFAKTSINNTFDLYTLWMVGNFHPLGVDRPLYGLNKIFILLR